MLQLKCTLNNSKSDDNVMKFQNDEEFYDFCVNPDIVVCKCTDDPNDYRYYQTFNFTKSYIDALNSGKKFMICDEDSQIFKHGSVSHRTITKKVDNLVPYYDF